MVYGSFDDVSAVINLETSIATAALINTSLKRADATINRKLDLYNLPANLTSSTLEDVGTSLAIAETLQAVFASTEDANPKADYYFKEGMDALMDYITTAQEAEGLDHPYSATQSPLGNPSKPPWGQWEDLP